jgi:hypothetical protein
VSGNLVALSLEMVFIKSSIQTIVQFRIRRGKKYRTTPISKVTERKHGIPKEPKGKQKRTMVIPN